MCVGVGALAGRRLGCTSPFLSSLWTSRPQMVRKVAEVRQHSPPFGGVVDTPHRPSD